MGKFFAVFFLYFACWPLLAGDVINASNNQLVFPDSLEADVLFIGGYHQVTTSNGTTSLAKQENDFTGFVPIDGRSDSGYVIVNHESNVHDPRLGDGGGMTVFTVHRDDSGKWNVMDDPRGKYRNVDFSTVGGTYYNCGGFSTSWGTVITSEENLMANNLQLMRGGKGTLDTTAYIIDSFNGQQLNKAVPRYQNFGWLIEVDVVTGKALRKMYELGRCGHESGVILPDDRTVIITDDLTPGYIYKFVADVPRDLSTGQLSVYSQGENGIGGAWLPVKMELDSMIHLHDAAARAGATMFLRTEWIVYHKGKVYISETGNDNTAGHMADHAKNGARLSAHLQQLDAADGEADLTINDFYGRLLSLDMTSGQLDVFLEGGPSPADPRRNFAQPDCLALAEVKGKTYMVIHEDINNESMGRVPPGVTNKLNEIYWLDMAIEKPSIDDLHLMAIGPLGCETTGGCFSPDGSSYFFNVQHPSKDNIFPFNYPCTVAVRNFDSYLQKFGK